MTQAHTEPKSLHAADALKNAAPPIGIDIGGTKINAALVDLTREAGDRVQHLQNAATPTDATDFIETLAGMVNTLKQQGEVSAVGVSTAGAVDSINGRILGATGNLPALQHLPNLKAELESRVGLPVHVENDANAAAYGEWRAGAARGAKNSFAVTLGTGVGMGIIFDERMYRGSHFFAAEGGHIAISWHKERQCTCGRWDCWESYCSGWGLEITANLLAEAAPDEARTAFVSKYQTEGRISTYSVVQALKDGDPLGRQIIDTWHEHIALGIGSLINVMDPDIVVVGGGLAQFVDFDRLRGLTAERSMSGNCRLEPAQLGNLAGLVGAGYLALEAAR